jgi:predicted phage tail protein
VQRLRVTSLWVACVLLLVFGQATEAATITLAWDPPADSTPTGYLVRVGTQSGTYGAQIDVGLRTSFGVAGLTDGTRYFFVVLGYKAGGELTPPSLEVSSVAGPVLPGTPSAPTGFTATLRDARFLDLRWTPPPDTGLIGYRISAGSAPGQENVGSFTTGLTTTFTASDLPPGTYYVRVQAVNSAGPGQRSNEAAVTIGDGPGGLDAPRDLRATVTGRSLNLSWQPPADGLAVSGYLIEAGSASGAVDMTVSTHDPTFSAADVPDGTYFLRVKAVRAGRPGSPSNEVIAVIDGGSKPCKAKPGGPKSVTAAIAGTLIRLTWQRGDGDEPTGYVVEAGSAPGGRDVATLTFDANITTVGGPVPNGTYFLRVTAVNACGASTASSEVSVTVGGPPPVLPGPPVGLVGDVTGSAVSLAWSQPVTGGAPSRYIIEATDAAGNPLVTIDTGNAATTFAHAGVPEGIYIVRIRGANAAGIGPASHPLTVTVTP